VTDVPVDTVALIVPTDERPLQGEAGWVDWRMCGRISELLAAGYARGEVGEAVLVPSTPPLEAVRVVLIGAGAARELRDRALRGAAQDVAEKLLGLRATMAAVAVPGAVDVEHDIEDLLRGFVHGVAASSDPDARLQLVLALDPGREKSFLAVVSRVIGAARTRDVAVEVRWLEADSDEEIAVEPA
jgi:hypothetical protein